MVSENGSGENRIALHVNAGRKRENRGNSVRPFANRGKRRRQSAAKPTGGVRLMQTGKDAGNLATNAGGNRWFAKNASGNVSREDNDSKNAKQYNRGKNDVRHVNNADVSARHWKRARDVRPNVASGPVASGGKTTSDAMIDTLYEHGKELIGADAYITLQPGTTGSEIVAIATATETE